MKLSEIKGEKALEVMADLLDPLAEIISDEEIKAVYEDKDKTYLDVAKLAIKSHTKALTAILALLDGENPETYEVSLLSLPKKVMEVMNDPDLKDLFQSQAMTTKGVSSLPATQTTTE